MLKENGYLIIVGVLEETFYVVDNIRWPTVFYTIENLRDAFKETSFHILFEDHIDLKRTEFNTSDCKGLFSIVAQLV